MRLLKSTFRQLGQSPAFAGTVIVTLALSIGANTAIFSIVDIGAQARYRRQQGWRLIAHQFPLFAIDVPSNI